MCKNTLFGGSCTTISGAKVQQKMHIRKYLSKKNTFFWVRNVQVAEMVEIGDHSKWYRSGNGVTIG